MRTLIRCNTFETNSSSTHSLSMGDMRELENLAYDLKDSIDEAETLDDLFEALNQVTRLNYLLNSKIDEVKNSETID